jgi:hypothetical protein
VGDWWGKHPSSRRVHMQSDKNLSDFQPVHRDRTQGDLLKRQTQSRLTIPNYASQHGPKV